VFSVSYSLNLKKQFGIEHIILDGSTLINLYSANVEFRVSS